MSVNKQTNEVNHKHTNTCGIPSLRNYTQRGPGYLEPVIPMDISPLNVFNRDFSIVPVYRVRCSSLFEITVNGTFPIL